MRITTESLAQLWREHAWAARRLSKTPAFTAVVAVTLGLAIGGNAAIYSVVSGVLLKPLPYPDPERLVRLFAQHPRFGEFPLSPLDVHTFREQRDLFDGVAGFYREGHEFNGSAGPENLEGLFVSAGYFEMLGARVALGRTFTRDDELPANADRVILSDRVWRTRLGADMAIVGKSLNLSRRPFLVVGVMAPGFQHVGGRQRSLPHGETADFWIPLTINPANLSRGRFVNTAARLASGRSLEPANAGLDRLARIQAAHWPDSHRDWRVHAVPLINDIVGGGSKRVLLAVFGAVGCVLLIACGNVACLTLGRSIARSRDHAVRAALGAGRLRIAREILIESWLLALLGAGLGIPLAIAGVRTVVELAPPHLPRLHAIGVDPSMFVFGMGITFVTSVLCGLLPAWHASRTNLEEALRESSRTEAPGGRTLGWHRGLAVVQCALCFVLLVCAGLLGRTFHQLLQNPIGFRPAGVLTMTFDLPGGAAKYGGNPPERAKFHDRLLTALRAEPSIVSAGSAARLPLAARFDATDSQGFTRLQIPGRLEADQPLVRIELISAGFLETLGVPLLEGRWFDARDTLTSAQVALANEELVRRHFNNQPVLGTTIGFARRAAITFVGIVGNIKATPTALAAEPTIYVPMSQSPLNRTRLAVRAHGDPLAVLPVVQRVVSNIDPELPVFDVRTLEQIAADAVATERFALLLFGLFAALALVLSVVGIYGVLAYTVAHRLPELGIRIALGARPVQLLKLVFVQGAAMTVAGVTLGAAASIVATRSIRGLLFGVQPFDPLTLGAVALLFSIVALSACLIPARRAARADPLAALRSE